MPSTCQSDRTKVIANFSIAVLQVILALIAVWLGRLCFTSKEPLEWNWAQEKADIAYCIEKHLPDYDVEIDDRAFSRSRVKIRTKTDRAIVYAVEEYDSVVFTRVKDILFIVEHSCCSSGGEVVALDLKTGTRLWKTRLFALGPISHSKYSCRVNIEATKDRIIIAGNESAGRFIEHLDLRTGRILRNQQFGPQ